MFMFGLATAANVDDVSAQVARLKIDNDYTLAQLVKQNTILIELLHKIGADMGTFEDAVGDLATLTTDMADRLDAAEAVNAELRAALANGEVAQAQALAAQAEQHTAAVQEISARLRGLGEDPENPVPDTTELPLVEAASDVEPEDDDTV